MKILLTFLLGLLSYSFSYSQTYVYTFEGDLELSSISFMEKECSTFQSIASVKIKYKEDSKKGEFYITLNEDEKNRRAESDFHFSPVDVKSYMISHNLSPLTFRQIKD